VRKERISGVMEREVPRERERKDGKMLWGSSVWRVRDWIVGSDVRRAEIWGERKSATKQGQV
jgi:hypothetical protein